MKYRNPAAPKALATLLVYVPIELNMLLIFSRRGSFEDLGNPRYIPLPRPNSMPATYETPTVKATWSPKSGVLTI